MKNKRSLGIIFLLAILLLTSCGNSNGASDKAIACAKKAIATAENYLDYNIDYKEALRIVDDLSDDMKYVNELPEDAPNHYADYNISFEITMLSYNIMSDGHDSSDETYKKIQESVEKLEDLIK